MTQHLPQDARRRQILEAARDCFIAYGYHAAQIAQIARYAGLSKGGIYFHFASKREIFEALLNEEFEASIAFLRAVNASSQTLPQKLTQLALHYLRLFTERNELARFRVVIGEMAIRDPDVRVRLLELNAAYHDEVTTLLLRAIESNDLRADLDAPAVARLLIAVMDGLQEQFALHPAVLFSEMERLTTAAVDVLLRGLAK